MPDRSVPRRREMSDDVRTLTTRRSSRDPCRDTCAASERSTAARLCVQDVSCLRCETAARARSEGEVRTSLLLRRVQGEGVARSEWEGAALNAENLPDREVFGLQCARGSMAWPAGRP